MIAAAVLVAAAIVLIVSMRLGFWFGWFGYAAVAVIACGPTLTYAESGQRTAAVIGQVIVMMSVYAAATAWHQQLTVTDTFDVLSQAVRAATQYLPVATAAGPTAVLVPAPAPGNVPASFGRHLYRVMPDEAAQAVGHPTGLVIWLDDALRALNEECYEAYGEGRADQLEDDDPVAATPLTFAVDDKVTGSGRLPGRHGDVGVVTRVIRDAFFVRWGEDRSEIGPYGAGELSHHTGDHDG